MDDRKKESRNDVLKRSGYGQVEGKRQSSTDAVLERFTRACPSETR